MRVADTMTRGVETTTSTTTLQAAALRMREAGVGMMPVVERGRPVGVVTDRDMVVRGTANGLDPKIGTVADVMTRGVVTCFEDDSIDDARALMLDRSIRRIVVLDSGGRLIGVISLDDLATLEAEERAGAAPDIRGERGAA